MLGNSSKKYEWELEFSLILHELFSFPAILLDQGKSVGLANIINTSYKVEKV